MFQSSMHLSLEVYAGIYVKERNDEMFEIFLKSEASSDLVMVSLSS